MSILDILRAEYRLVYAELYRRKTALISILLYPYIFALFVVTMGLIVGSFEGFESRIGVNPILYMITGSYLLLTILAGIDDLLWRPIYDMNIGTLPYIIASPVNKLLLYMLTPIPRLIVNIVIGFTSIFPIYVYINGLAGLYLASMVMVLSILGCLVMIPFAITIAMVAHRAGENYRVTNVIRPVILILIGVYYPRIYLPLAGYILSSLIPASHIIETIQRVLMGISGDTILLITVSVLISLLYYPLAGTTLREWEKAKVREGVKTS